MDLKPMEVGVFLSSLGIADHIEAVAKAKELGFRAIQTPPLAPDWRTGAEKAPFVGVVKGAGLHVSAVCAGFEGESYADIPTVKRTVGYVDEATVHQRINVTLEYARLAQELDCPVVTTHIGFVPEDRDDPVYARQLMAVRRVCDALAGMNLLFGLETGQEEALPMKHFIEAVGRPNLRVNFDPANMILYGKQNPVQALGILKDYVCHVHCKDGKWPTEEGKLGTEVPLGEGEVDIPAYVHKLKEIGYTGILTIEREAGTNRIGDIVQAKQLLERLRDEV